MAVFSAATALSHYSGCFGPALSCEESILPVTETHSPYLWLPTELSIWMPFSLILQRGSVALVRSLKYNYDKIVKIFST